VAGELDGNQPVKGQAMNEVNRDNQIQQGAADDSREAEKKSVQALEGTRLSPELLEWARRQFTEEEILVGLRELREKGGQELADFLPELERMVAHP
jgi:hypothetical protein